MVLETGDPKYYLFQLLVGETMIAAQLPGFPVRKTDLVPEIRRALRHGVGNSL